MIPSKRLGGGTRERVRGEAERVPLLGLFVVIVPLFLLIAASAHWTLLDADAASAEEETALLFPPERTGLRLTVLPGGLLWHGKEGPAAASAEEIARALALLKSEGRGEEPVTLVAAKGAPYAEVRRVLDLCRNAGRRTVRLEAVP